MVDQPEVPATLVIGGDLPVRRLGFGAMRITGRGIWGAPPDPATSIAVLRRAVELGVDVIDTADAYGPDVSESLIAEALFPYPDGLVVATKGGLLRDGPDQWRPDGRPEHLRAACDGSLQRLRLEQIPLYQFHRPDPRVPFEESVGAIVELQQEGKVRHIGLSNVSDAQLAAALRHTPIVSVQNQFGLGSSGSSAVIDRCEQEGIAFIPWGPLGQAGPAHDAAAAEVATHHDATPTQVAIAWLLHRSPVMVPIPGTNSVAHLEENVAAAEIRLTADERQRLDDAGGRRRPWRRHR